MFKVLANSNQGDGYSMSPYSFEIDLFRFPINCFYRKNKPEKAIEIFKLSIAKYPGSYLDYSNMAQIYEELKKPQQAIENYKLALSNTGSGYFKLHCADKIRELSAFLNKN